MLDENLPTFQFRQAPEKPLQSAVYFSQNGSEPAAEYVFERAHPSTNPAAAKKYAVALKDPYAQDVVYAEVVVNPEWEQPTLSAAEIRAQQSQPNGARVQPAPLIPDSFTIQLYDPDQTVLVRYIPGSLTKSDSWEFEMLSQSFKMPTPSQLDRQNTGTPADFRPRIMFKWKRDSRLSKDMTCYNVGKSLGKHKSKEPDITVALFKMSRETTITVYEPNLQRVEMEDRKGLDIVLVIGAEVIRDMYLAPEKRPDLFNLGAGAPGPSLNGKRKNSRGSPPLTAPATVSGAMARTRPAQNGPIAMSGALGSIAPANMTAANTPAAYNSNKHSSPPRRNDSAVDAETERLKKMVEEESRREAAARAAERERRDREEARRIERMLAEEENEKRRRQSEVDRETERLKRLYGTQGQDLPSSAPPPLHGPPGPQQQWQGNQRPQPPARPLSAGPGRPMGHSSGSSLSNLFSRPSGSQQQASQQQAGPSRPSGRPGQGPYMSGSNTVAAVSGFFQNVLDPKKNQKMTKKKSMQW